MRLLLTTLNSKYIHGNLALKYLYSAAGSHRKAIDIKEFSVNNDDDYIFTEIIRGRYDVVCFSCYIWNVERVLGLSENIKKANWKTRIVAGGPEVSFDTAEFLKENPFIDIVIAGEGELPFARLLDTMHEGDAELSGIPGLTYRQGGKIYVNEKPSQVGMDQLEFPYAMLPLETDKVIYYESSRGCPYRCAYCLSSIEKGMRALGMDRVKSELDYFLFNKVMQVKFIDRTFNWDQDRSNEIIRYIIANDNGVTNFHFELCGDLIGQQFLQLLKTARKGLFQFEIGVQSTNPRTLDACDRKTDWSKLKYNVEKIMETENAHLHLDLIAGLPFEDYSSFRNSFNEVYALKPDHLQLGFLKLLKGSPIREQVEQYRYIYREKAPYEVISNIFISAGDMVRLKMAENILELYYNRKGFRDTLSYATVFLAATPFDFYEELASFYYLKGYQHKSHKKEDLYRIFMKYAEWKERHQQGVRDKIRELLQWDMASSMNPEAVKKFERKGWEIC